MMSCRGNLGQRDALISPSDQVAGTGDLHFGLIAAPFDDTRLVELKQLRMQRATVDMKHQLSNLRSYDRHR
jgi:hypothetical protein